MIATYEELPPPWAHQAEAVPLLCRGSYALYWDRRMGKTRACFEALRIEHAERRLDAVLIVAPVNALTTWERWLDLMLPDWAPAFVCNGLDGQPIESMFNAVIVNPEILNAGARPGGFQGWLSSLLGWLQGRRVALIQDEAHMYATNPMSQEYKDVRNLGLCCDRVWQLTGTPTGGGTGLQLHHLLRHLGPSYPYYWWPWDRFGEAYCNKTFNRHRGRLVSGVSKSGRRYERRTGGWDYLGLKDEDRLWLNLEAIADRRLRRDALDLKQTRRLDVWVGTMPQSRRPADWLRNRQALASLKVQATVRYVKALLEEDPSARIVVGGWSKSFTQGVSAAFNSPLIRGGTTRLQRTRIVDQFQDEQHRVVVLNIVAGGTSIELSRGTHVVIGEMDLDARANRQFEDRTIDVSDPNKDNLVHYLLFRGSVDEWVWDTVLMKGHGMDRLDEAAARLRAAGVQ